MHDEVVDAICISSGLARGACGGHDMARDIQVVHIAADLVWRRIEVTSDDERLAVLAEVGGDSLEQILGEPMVVDIAINRDEYAVAYSGRDGHTYGTAWCNLFNRVSLAVAPPCYSDSSGGASLYRVGGRGELAAIALFLEFFFGSLDVGIAFTGDGVGDVGFLQQKDILHAILHDFVFEGSEGVGVGGKAHQRC